MRAGRAAVWARHAPALSTHCGRGKQNGPFWVCRQKRCLGVSRTLVHSSVHSAARSGRLLRAPEPCAVCARLCAGSWGVLGWSHCQHFRFAAGPRRPLTCTTSSALVQDHFCEAGDIVWRGRGHDHLCMAHAGARSRHPRCSVLSITCGSRCACTFACMPYWPRTRRI